MAKLIEEPYRHRRHAVIDYTEAKVAMLEEEGSIELT